MSLDDLGEAPLEGTVEGLAQSIPLPPDSAGGPPLPPPPGGGDDGEVDVDAGGPVHPERRATVPVVLALALTVVVGVGAFALVSWAGGGSSCEDGDFESVRFGYCVRAPSGWVAEAAEVDAASHDLFLLPSGAATITVTAVPLTKGQDLARFEQFVRGYDEDAGGSTGSSTSLEVDGADAVAFDVTVDAPDGVVRSREVLFTRNGVAWRVTLADDEIGFGSSIRRLDELLDSWRFT
ncbi:MAG TPA: hypothetical protein VFP41_06460 [Actinomycetota bacterium]|nr:hypothetical protein [Actinomycetota bacterium]